MKLSFHDLPRKCQFPLLLACGSMPLVLLAFAHWAQELLFLAWILAGCYLGLAILGLTVPGKWRLLYGLAGTALLTALGGCLTFYFSSPCPMAAAIFYGALLLWGLRFAAWSWDEEFSFYALILGLAIHIGAQFLLTFVHRSGLADLHRAETGLLAAFWGYMLLALLSMNRDSLFFAAKGRQRASLPMRSLNLLLTAGLALAATLISMMPAAATAIRSFFLWLKDLMVGDPVPEDIPAQQPTVPSVPASAVLPDAAQEEASQFAIFLDKLMLVLTRILLVVIFLLGAYLLVKWLIRLTRKALQWLSRYTASVSEDYVDEVTDIRDLDFQRESLLQRLRPRGTFPQNRELSPQQQIRQRYRQLLTKRKFSPGSTSRENLPEDAASLYERARYSGHPISPGDAAAFRSKTKKL